MSTVAKQQWSAPLALTPEQAAVALSMSRDTFDRYVRDELRLVRVGRKVLVPVSELERWLDRFFGGPLEHVTRPRRHTSYLATVVLDLAAAFELNSLYNDARNDFIASDASLGVPLPRDDDAQYQVARADVPLDTSPKYADVWSDGDGWRMSSHHDDDLSRYYLGRIDRVWDFIAICSVTRDRHWVAAIRAVIAG